MISRLFGAALGAALFGLPAAAAAQDINSAVLPNGRSVETGEAASFFVAVSNSGAAAATDCAIALGAFNTAPVTLTYQTADNALNLTGTPDTPADIGAGETQFFVVGLTPSAEYDGVVPLSYACANATALGRPGVNDIVLVAQDGPDVVDILSVSLTPSGDGVIRVGTAGGVQVMTISAVYPGPGANTADIRVTPSIPGYPLAAALEICETDATSTCTSARGDFVDTTFTQDGIKYFAIFLDAPDAGGLPLYPDLLRVRASFVDQDAGGAQGEGDTPQAGPPFTRSITSQAAYAPAPGDAADTGEGFYQFRIRDLINDPTGDFTAPGEMVVLPDGRAMGAIQVIEGVSPYWQVFSLDGGFNPEGQNGPVFGGQLVLYETHDGQTALTGDFTMRYDPAAGFLAQFDGRAGGAQPDFSLRGPSHASGQNPGDPPVYFRSSLLQFQALMLSGLFIATIGDLTGAYTVSDPQSQAVIGTMTVSGTLATALFTLPGSPTECAMNLEMHRQIATAALVLADVIISQCGVAGSYSGVGVADTLTVSGQMMLRLYLASQIQGLYLTMLLVPE